MQLEVIRCSPAIVPIQAAKMTLAASQNTSFSFAVQTQTDVAANYTCSGISDSQARCHLSNAYR